MDKQHYGRGLAKRRQVLCDAYVDLAMANVNDFSRDFQRLATEYCWSEAWGDEALSPRVRSILILGMVAGIGKMGPSEGINDPQLRANDIVVPLEVAGENLKFTMSLMCH